MDFNKKFIFYNIMHYHKIIESVSNMWEAIEPDTPIYGVIGRARILGSSAALGSGTHGRLDKPLVEGEKVIYNRLPTNINLLLVGSHGKVQYGDSNEKVQLEKTKKRLELMQKYLNKELFDRPEWEELRQIRRDLIDQFVRLTGEDLLQSEPKPSDAT